MLDHFQFHPELLALAEKQNIKEVVFRKRQIQYDDINRKGYQPKVKRFWSTDYPLLSYAVPAQDDDAEDNLESVLDQFQGYDTLIKDIVVRGVVMAHLSDPTAQKVTFSLEEDETFVAFVDKFPEQREASIGFLVIKKTEKSEESKYQKKTRRLIYRKYTYKNPFEKKDFTNVNSFWRR